MVFGSASVGTAVASKARDPRFISSHEQFHFKPTVLNRQKIRKRSRVWSIFEKGLKDFFAKTQFQLARVQPLRQRGRIRPEVGLACGPRHCLGVVSRTPGPGTTTTLAQRH